MSTPMLELPPDGDVNRAPTVLGVFSALTVLALLFLAARLYTRFRITKAAGWDDLILTVNMFLFIIPNLVLIGVQSKYGMGRHVYFLSNEQLLEELKWAFIGDIFGIMMSAVPRIAVVIFLHRCLGKVRKSSIYLLYAMVAALNMIAIVNVILVFVQCDPVRALWTAGVQASCWDPRVQVKYAYFYGSVSAFMDLVLALYPLTFIPQLKMRLKQKIAACCVMGLGVFACGCAAARTSLLAAGSHSADTTWDSGPLYIWAGAEANVITICASAPMLVPLILHKMRSGNGIDGNYWSRNGTTPGDSRTPLRNHRFTTTRGSSLTGSAIDTGESGKKAFDHRILATREFSVENMDALETR